MDEIFFKKTVEYWYERRFSPPPDHYFHTYFAYSCYSLNLVEMADECLNIYFSIKEKGHKEFNKIALASILLEFSHLLSANIHLAIEKEVFSDDYSVDFTTTTGNNWLFLRALLHLKKYQLAKKDSDAENFVKYTKHIISFNSEGMFYDFPPQKINANEQEMAIPLTYTFKMLSILIEIHFILKEINFFGELLLEIERVILQCLPKHLDFIAPDGESLYYGRSDNTLFGYANIIYILSKLTSKSDFVQENKSCETFIVNNFSEDGVLKYCLPYQGFRDSYIFDSVYISYFLAKVIQARRENGELNYCRAHEKESERPFICSKLGFIYRDKNFFAFISSTGSIPQSKPDEFWGYRYSGLTPFKVSPCGSESTSLLGINRGNIKKASSNLPFVPLNKFFFFSIVHLNFTKLHVKQEANVYIIEGTSVPFLMIENGFLKRVFKKIARFCPVDISSPFQLLLQKIISTKRTIFIDAALQRIEIVDINNRFFRVHYAVPSFWSFESESTEQYFDLGDSLKYICKASKEACKLTFQSR